MKKDHLIVLAEGGVMLDACLIASTIPADSVGPAHKKYGYQLSNGGAVASTFTKADALDCLIAVATERGWKVLLPLN